MHATLHILGEREREKKRRASERQRERQNEGEVSPIEYLSDTLCLSCTWDKLEKKKKKKKELLSTPKGIR